MRLSRPGAARKVPSVPAEASVPNPHVATTASHDLRAVLRIAPFRRLWGALALSSLGDWLGLLATTSMATSLTTSYRGHLYATGAVLAMRMAPALLFGPFAGAFADRFDRRHTMVFCDTARCAMFVSIAVVHTLGYLLVASFVVEIFSLFWIPAKEASVPNLVPRSRLEAANQVSLVTTYGMAPVAAAIFALLAVLSRVLGTGNRFFTTNPNSLALWFDAATFAFSALTVFQLREIKRARGAAAPRGSRAEPDQDRAGADGGRAGDAPATPPPTFLRSIVEGWRFVGTTSMVRGLVVGILGAFAAGGAVVALGRVFVTDLGGGAAAYGVLFGAVFLGLAMGMLTGPRLVHAFSRRRLFGLCITGAGLTLAVTSVLPNLVVAVATTTAVGCFAGAAWVTGYTLLGGEVDDAVRGRTFALVQSLVQVDLLAVLAVAPFVAGAIGPHYVHVLHGRVRFDGVTIVLLVAGLFAAGIGVLSYRQMDDRPGVPLWPDLLAGVRGRRYRHRPHAGGLFIAFEGGEGAGKSTQVGRLAEWLAARGCDVVVTREPGATAIGRRLRELLLDRASDISPRAEALLYAADRAAHVERVIAPAVKRGAVVVTDRFVDSSIAYQGAGRALDRQEVAELSSWATGGLRPDLTVLLDVDPETGLRRFSGPADRIESESLAFHRRVRDGFLELARQRPERYLVVDADQDPDVVAGLVRERVAGLLPEPVDDEPVRPVTDVLVRGER